MSAASGKPESMETEYRAIFESTIDGLVIMGMDGTIVEANTAACEMLGYPYAELIGLSAAVLTPPEILPRLTQALECAAEGRPIPAEPATKTIRKDGVVLDSETRARVFHYRGKPHVLAVMRDITERTRAEERLGEKEEQYRSVFESTSDSLIIGNAEGIVVEVNPAACRLYGYAHNEFVGLPVSSLIHPDYRHAGEEQGRTIEEGGTVHVEELALRKDGTAFNAEVRGVRFLYAGRPMRLAVVRDITDRVRAQEILEQRVEERTHELATLLDVSYKVSSMLELQPLMDQILDQIAGVVEYEGATISLIEGDESEVVAVRGRGSPEVALGLRIPVRQLDPAWESWRAGPYIIHDVQDDSPDAVSYRQWRDAVLDSSFSYIRSWLVAPFIVNERLVGVLTLHGDRPGMYSPHHAALIFGIANQAAVAIENARLYAASEQRARELATLLDISRNVASTLQIHPLLDLILQELGSAVRYDGAGIVTLDRDEVRIVRQRGPDAYLIPPETRIPMAEARPLWSLIVQREGIIIDDVRGETDEAEIYRELVGQSAESYPYIRSWMAVPMRVKDRAIGALFLAHSEPASYTAHHAEMALAVAQQAAIAIENARLYERAQEVAVLEERQRLSRELHDSVSQALYGIALGAQTARAVVERDPSQVVQPLDYVLSLAQTAMSEMRGLIFELRPEAVEQEGLVAVLRQQAKAAGARHGVQVTMTDSDEPSLPLEVKEALYRVAQEALHNAVKHAGAAAIALSLERDDGAVVLTVQDDGKGFDPAESFPGHLGLYSMRERAEGLGGTLAIESAPGAGTRVSVRVAPAPVD